MAIKINGFKDRTNKGKIIDYYDPDKFGIQLHDAWTIEQFQELSGMEGPYRDEYQHHYINLVARMKIGRQTLDIGIPLVLFNYDQIVGGAHIEFELDDVDNAQEEAMKIANKKAEEVLDSDIGKFLYDMGFEKFQINGYNNIHIHPNGVNSFSGTDYKKNIDNPGVVYPLKECEDAPIFSGIIQHKANKAYLMHMEFRVADKKGDDIIYKQGRCITIVRGFKEEIEEIVQKVKEPGVFDQMFGTKPPPPPPPPIPHEIKSYYLTSKMTDADKTLMEEKIKELLDIWDKTEYYPDLTLIDKKNIRTSKFGNSKSFKPKSYNRSTFTQNDYEDWGYEYDSLFGYSTHRKKKTYESDYDKDGPSYFEMRDYLLKGNYTIGDLAEMTHEEIVNVYWLERLEDAELEADEATSQKSHEELVDILLGDGLITPRESLTMNEEQIKQLYEDAYHEV